MKRSVFVLFSLDELWLLQSVIRHEIAQREQWKFPPADRDLNDKVAEAIIFCEDHSEKEASLEVTQGDLYAIDYCVQASAKNAAGQLVGKPLLLKSFRARRQMEDELFLVSSTTEEPPIDWQTKFAEFNARKPRRGKP